MYNVSFGVQEAPFGLTPDPKFMYLSAQHRNALAGLTYGILSRKRFILLVGDVGTGKTTLVRTALKHMSSKRTNVGLITNPTLTPGEVLEAALMAFGQNDIPSGKVKRLRRLEELLEHDTQENRTSTLIIDEAHKLEYEALEEIRLLGNLDPLQIVLAGQNELVDLLDSEQGRAFKQRISLRLTLEPLSPAEVAQYVAHRWKIAGGRLPAPFESPALGRLAQESQGIPRLINTLADNALLIAFQENRRIATSHDIGEASVQLRVSTPETPVVLEAADIDPGHENNAGRQFSDASGQSLSRTEPSGRRRSKQNGVFARVMRMGRSA
jgi:general secretion pathway protein A